MTDANSTLQKYKQQHYALQKEHQQSIKEMENMRKELESMKEENHRLKQKLPVTQREPLTAEFWDMIRKSVRSNDFDTIKQLVNQKKLDMMDIDPRTGQTVLLMAAKAGAYDIVQLCINLDACLDTVDKSGKSALVLARDGAWTHVERLLLFSTMNANVGDSILNSANTINRQRGIIENILNQLNSYVKRKQIFKDTVVDLMIGIIENKLAFSDDLLNLAWQFACGDDISTCNPLSTKLWKSIQKTCKQVIENGTKRDWFWFRSFIVPSTIWYKSISVVDAKKNVPSASAHGVDKLGGISSIQSVEDLAEHIDSVKAKTQSQGQSVCEATRYLYYELLNLVDNEAKTDLNVLQADLSRNKEEDAEQWNKLIRWNLPLPVNGETTVRQDKVPNGIVPQYTFDELTQRGGAANTTFNVHSHYDLNQYLPQLILLAHIVDDDFQQSVRTILDIDKDTHSAIIRVPDDEESKSSGNGQVRYMRGPVKLMERARAKAESDYAQDVYPTSASVLDLNRCALVFDDISTLLMGLTLFTNKVRYYQSGAIIGIVRVKNGFIEYDKEAQYADIKLNVLIKGAQMNIVGEVQFLLQRMLDFKRKAHNMYSIQRTAEYMESSVKQILPSLTDDTKELFVAGNGGDVASLLRLMVIHNKTDQDLMQIDEESQESILVNICALGHVKALRFLCDKSVVRRDKLITALFSPNRYNSSPVEAGISHQSLALTQVLFSIPELLSMYQTNDRQLYRLLIILYRAMSYDKRVAQHVMNRLKLSSQRLVKMMHFEYKPDAFKDKRFAERFVGHLLPSVIALTGDMDAITWFSGTVGEKVFMDCLVNEADIYNITSLEWCLIHYGKKKNKNRNIEVLKYLISHPVVSETLKENMERTFRVLYWTFSAFKPDAFEVLMQILNLDEKDRLLAVLQYEDKGAKDVAPTGLTKKKVKSGRKRIEYGEKLMVLLTKTDHIDLCQKVAEIIGAKAFTNLLFEANILNTSAWEWAIVKSSMEGIEWILKMAPVKEYILQNKEVLYRTIFWILCRYREPVWQFVTKELQITDTILTDLVPYRPTRPPAGTFHAKAKEYWDKGLIAIACTSNDVAIVQRLADMVDPIEFAKDVFTSNRNDLNILEFLIQKRKFEMVKYVVKLEQIQTILKQDDTRLFRVVYWMLRQYDTKIFDFVANILQFNAQTFIKLLNLKVTPDKGDTGDNDDDEKTPRESTRYQYERYNLVQASVRCSLDCMKRLLSYMDADLFVSKLFDVNGVNVNAMESASGDINKLKLIFALQSDGISLSEVQRYRLICYSASDSNDECFNYILKALKIDDERLSKLLLFRYPKQQFDAQQFDKRERLIHMRSYHDKTLLSWCAMSLSKERVLRILRLIPIDKRLSYLMEKDGNQINPFRFIVTEHKLDLANDILNMMEKEDKVKLIESTLIEIEDEKLKIKLKEMVNV